jgi:hypothetical protein
VATCHQTFKPLSVFEFSFKKKKQERLTLIITKELKTAGLSFMYAIFSALGMIN